MVSGSSDGPADRLAMVSGASGLRVVGGLNFRGLLSLTAGMCILKMRGFSIQWRIGRWLRTAGRADWLTGSTHRICLLTIVSIGGVVAEGGHTYVRVRIFVRNI